MAVLTEVFTFLIVRRMSLVIHPDLLLLSVGGMGKIHGPAEEHGGEDEDDVDDGQDKAYLSNLEIQCYLNLNVDKS